MNGRVDIMNQPNIFDLYDKIPIAQNPTEYRDAMIGNWNNSILSKTYFSKENIQIIQNGIRAGIYNETNGRYVIAPQDEDTLKVIMRSTFLQYSKNLPNNIRGQVEELNKKVLDYSIKQILGEIQGYIKYKHDVSTLAMPHQLPTLSTMKGQNQLELKPWF